MSISKKELKLLQEVSTTYCERWRGSRKVSFTSSESIGFRRIWFICADGILGSFSSSSLLNVVWEVTRWQETTQVIESDCSWRKVTQGLNCHRGVLAGLGCEFRFEWGIFKREKNAKWMKFRSVDSEMLGKVKQSF
jgi:hypothetical protein